VRFAIWDHAGKGDYLRQCLLAAGHTQADTVDTTDLLLLDCDWRWARPRPDLIGAAAAAGAKIVLFPHGGHPTVFVYDGLTEPDPRVDLRLEHGQGTVDVARELGLELRQEATGWLFSPTSGFEVVDHPKRLLFAPQHPNMETIFSGNGHDPAAKLNNLVYRRLLELDYDMTVTMVGPPWKNGLFYHPNVVFVDNPHMVFSQSYQLVRQADIVVGAGTVAVTAVACGKPTVMMGQGNYADYVDGSYRLPDNTGVYDDVLRYPLDADTDDVADLIVQACLGDDDAAGWRHRFVGDDGSVAAVGLLERLVQPVSPSSLSVIIDGVTARATGLGG